MQVFSPEVDDAFRKATAAYQPGPGEWADLPTARHWYDVAVDRGGADVLWHIADLAFRTDMCHAWGDPGFTLIHTRWCMTLWARAILSDHDRSGFPGRLAPDVLGPLFSPYPDFLAQNWSFALTTPRTDDATDVLERVRRRCLLVAENGQELSAEEIHSIRLGGEPLYTPNCILPPEVTDGTVRIMMNCKDTVSAPMARRMLAVLYEELQRRELTDADIGAAYYDMPRLTLPWDDTNRRFDLP